jgi:hypothetical protein
MAGPIRARHGLNNLRESRRRAFDKLDLEDMAEMEEQEDDMQPKVSRKALSMRPPQNKLQGGEGEEEIGNEYKSEDELEDMMSQLDDTESLISDASSSIQAPQNMIVKFNLHKQLKEQLEQDLS